MGAWRVALSDQAERDLERVTAFLARKSVSAGERIGLEIVGVIFSLDELPARGAPVRGRPGLRKVVHRHYHVFTGCTRRRGSWSSCAFGTAGSIRPAWSCPRNALPFVG